MKNYILVAVLLAAVLPAFSQEDTILRGKIKADGLEGTNIHIINITQKTGTVNTASGEFQIAVRENDTLLFTSIQYKKSEIRVTRNILKAMPLIVELTEDINILTEVTVSNIKLTGNLRVDSGEMEVAPLPVFSNAGAYINTHFESDIADGQAAPENLALREYRTQLPTDVDILGIAALLVDLIKKKEPKKTISKKPTTTIIAQMQKKFKVDFFESTLKIDEEYIEDFIYYAEDHGLNREMIDGDELALIEFLIGQSKNYHIGSGKI